MFGKNNFVHNEINRLWWLFRIVYGVAFIGSGLDKFFHFLINWHLQGIPYFLQNIGISQDTIFYIRGGFEVIIGIALFTRWVIPAAYSAGVCLLLSAIYAILVPDHFDVSMRYAVIALGAYNLAWLTILREKLS